ncbi:MAG TPA: crossover junction endodeoxyribonuclease RuvC [Oligoflexia bacterium]|nr:crossover junction endodeoxyribonuclease RuvC [Oligoflexia bacterium]
MTDPIKSAIRVLGIDPGSRLMGFGMVSKNGTKLTTSGYGTLKFNTKVEANERLIEIYDGVRALLEKFKPDHVAIEKVFFAKNVVSALKLGQARGVAVLAVAQAGIPIYEYSPNEIKLSTVGFGHADKIQVAKMVRLLLGVENFESADSSDALAIAICHLQTHQFRRNLPRGAEL